MFKRLLQGLLIGFVLAVANLFWELWRVQEFGVDSILWTISRFSLLGLLLVFISVAFSFVYWRSELQIAYRKKTGRYLGRPWPMEEKIAMGIVFVLILCLSFFMAYFFGYRLP